ncbi:MAG: cation:proton antiporter [Gammaproteobacteria bacterium]|nr:MAG: cation:proton antiporter [Gammaproteobacteria bacterium]
MLAWWILGAFALGLLARQIGLPPLVGFLTAGFLLKGFGFESVPEIAEIGEVGVWLLLFTVGLKLRLRSLIRPEVWGTAVLHLVVSGGIAALLVRTQVDLSWTAAWMLGAAFAFSSTVFAAIVLEPRRELRAFHGRVAIGILILQDLVAVMVLAAGEHVTPSPWALMLLVLPLARVLLDRLVSITGHGELLPLLGVLLAVAAGGYGFRALGLSAELGSLVLGAMLAGNQRAGELGNALWGMKELFLVGFFVSVGLTATPTLETVTGAAALILALPLKVLLFFVLLLGIGLRSRSSFLASLSLASYSEFGLIVMQMGVRGGLLESQWITLAALAVAGSFIVAAPLNRAAHRLYAGSEGFLQRFERSRRHPDDEPVSVGSAEVLVVGMGRVGSGAYRYLKDLGLHVVGMDSDTAKVEKHLQEGWRVVYADAEDPELWHRLRLGRVRAVMLALPDLEAKIIASRQLRARGFRGLIAATYVFDEEREPVIAAGCDVAYNYFSEAGTGFAAHTADALTRSAVAPGTRRG